MKNAWLLLSILTLASPALAQYEPPVEEAPAEEAAAEEAPAEEAPAEEAAAEEAPADEGEPMPIYLGVDQAMTTLSVSSLSGFDEQDYDSGQYRLKVGAVPIESIAVEFQVGFDNGGDAPDEVSTASYYGLYLVPHTTIIGGLELAFPVGYAKSSVERPGASSDLDSLAYGIDAQFPLRVFGESMPNLRVGGGGMVYYQRGDARLYGFSFGLRYDFAGGLGIGSFLSNLWPFGDDEEIPPAEEAPAEVVPAEEPPAE